MNLRYLPAQILATFTGRRYFPDFEWSESSWTHNIFRFFGLIFGEKYGVRPSCGLWSDGETTVYSFHTVEAFLAHGEGMVRGFLPRRLPVRVFIPMLQTTAGFPIPASPFLFAIAFDSSARNGGADASSRTAAMTCTGSNLILIGAGSTTSVSSITGATYNSVAMTATSGNLNTGASQILRQFGLVGPSTGTNNFIVSSNATNLDVVACESYTGCSQSGFPDSSNSLDSQGSATTFQIGTTTIADNCWLAGCISGNRTFTVAAGTTQRQNLAQNHEGSLGDSNGAKSPAGAYHMDWTSSMATTWCAAIVSIAPPAPSSIKTVDGLAIASVKTVMGLARASVKTIDGLA